MEFALSQQALQSGANILNSKLDQVNYQKIFRYLKLLCYRENRIDFISIFQK
jgi:hypothetical protein